MQKRNHPHTYESFIACATPIQNGCLVWVGAKSKAGYGFAAHRGRHSVAHRIAYALAFPEVDITGLDVDHICNRRDCINPAHLRVVTHAQNMQAAAERRSTCRKGHTWDAQNTYIGTVKRKQGGVLTKRYCRKCRAEHQALRRAVLAQLNPKRTT